MKKIIRNKTHPGFTLIEIIVAIIILTIGILAVSQMTVLGMKTSSAINTKMYARSAMDNWCGMLNSRPPNDSLLADDGDAGDLDDYTNPDHSTGINNQATGNISYTIAWNIAANTPDIRFMTIRVHVLWLSQRISATLIKPY